MDSASSLAMPLLRFAFCGYFKDEHQSTPESSDDEPEESFVGAGGQEARPKDFKKGEVKRKGKKKQPNSRSITFESCAVKCIPL